jgi:uncharacterized glyoxalase superfamily protein PhnB
VAIAFERTIPVLRIFSVEKAREFYGGFLGFKEEWLHRFAPTTPVYMQVARTGVVLHLTAHHGDSCPVSTVLVRMTGIEAFRRELIASGYRYARPGIEDTPWGTRELEVTDPFGNRIRFSEATDQRP